MIFAIIMVGTVTATKDGFYKNALNDAIRNGHDAVIQHEHFTENREHPGRFMLDTIALFMTQNLEDFSEETLNTHLNNGIDDANETIPRWHAHAITNGRGEMFAKLKLPHDVECVAKYLREFFQNIGQPGLEAEARRLRMEAIEAAHADVDIKLWRYYQRIVIRAGQTVYYPVTNEVRNEMGRPKVHTKLKYGDLQSIQLRIKAYLDDNHREEMARNSVMDGLTNVANSAFNDGEFVEEVTEEHVKFVTDTFKEFLEVNYFGTNENFNNGNLNPLRDARRRLNSTEQLLSRLL